MDRLITTVRPYAWGSTTAIPQLLGVEPDGRPQAELWMGAHPGAPSLVDRGTGPRSLAEVIAEDPERELGAADVERFGPTLPFLTKILAAAEPLSLQVHPNLDQARAGFAAENAAGVPLDAPDRNYRDANHKPELISALTEFDGLCGFRPARDTAALLAALDLPELDPYRATLAGRPEPDALRAVFTSILSRRHGVTERPAVPGLPAALDRLAAAGGPFAAAAGAYREIAERYPADPGTLAALLLNHVRLRPGEAMYLAAGVPHAYLRGTGVEIMANSDNVLRCGLTPKHVDVPELLRIVDFAGTEAAVLRPEDEPGGWQVYRTPVTEFRLRRAELDDRRQEAVLFAGGPRVLLCTEGRLHVGGLDLTPGQSAFAPAAQGRLRMTGTGTAYLATTAG